MMYIIYNNDGSIKEKNLNEFIQQGSNEVNKIKVAIVGYEPESYLMEIRCKLPNDEVVPFSTFETTTIADNLGTEYNGYEFEIPDTVTALPGIVRVNIVLIEDESYKKLVTYSLYLSINEGTSGSVAAVISEQEYNNLLSVIGGKADAASTIPVVNYSSYSLVKTIIGDNNLWNKPVVLQHVEEGIVAEKHIGYIAKYSDRALKFDLTYLGGPSLGLDLVPYYGAFPNNYISGVSAIVDDVNTVTFKNSIFKNDYINNYQTTKNMISSWGFIALDFQYPNATLVKSTTDALNTRIRNLENIGRFLSLWDASTGVATSNPPTSPYTYKTGDYFRVSVGGNRIPTGSSYTIGGVNYEESEVVTLGVGDMVYYDGTTWQLQLAGSGGNIVDVQFNDETVVESGIAKITSYKNLSTLNNSNQVTEGVFDSFSVQTKFPVFESYDDVEDLSLADFDTTFGTDYEHINDHYYDWLPYCSVLFGVLKANTGGTITYETYLLNFSITAGMTIYVNSYKKLSEKGTFYKFYNSPIWYLPVSDPFTSTAETAPYIKTDYTYKDSLRGVINPNTPSIASGNEGLVTGGQVYTALSTKANTSDLPHLYQHHIRIVLTGFSGLGISELGVIEFDLHTTYGTALTQFSDFLLLPENTYKCNWTGRIKGTSSTTFNGTIAYPTSISFTSGGTVIIPSLTVKGFADATSLTQSDEKTIGINTFSGYTDIAVSDDVIQIF